MIGTQIGYRDDKGNNGIDEEREERREGERKRRERGERKRREERERV
jgi:hypothetical protein